MSGTQPYEENLSDLFFEKSPLPTWVFELSTLRFLKVNSAAVEAYGYSKEQFLKMTLLDIRPPREIPKLKSLIHQESQLHGRTTFEARWIHRLANGSEIYADVSSRLIQFEGREALLSVIKNVTSQEVRERAMKEREDKMQFLLEQMPAILWSVDKNFKITCSWGKGLEKTGYQSHEMEGQNLFDVLQTRDPKDPLLVNIFAAMNGEARSYEQDWKTVFFENHVEPLRNERGEIEGVVGISVDVTERKKFEEQLRETAIDLNRSHRELEHLAYVASHDLQEPLRMVASYVSLIRKRLGPSLEPEISDYIGFAVDGVKRMKRLIDDLLVYSRVSRVEKEFDAVDLNLVMEKVLSDLKPELDQAKANVEVATLPSILGDDHHIVLLFTNLVQNALKFRRQSPPQIKIRSEKQNDGKIRVLVQDDGIGFDMSQADRIFRIFQTLHTRGEYPGTGVGLAICNKIVDRHQGKIWAESDLGKGSCFYVTLSQAPSELTH